MTEEEFGAPPNTLDLHRVASIMKQVIVRFFKEEEAASAVEYALLAAGIAAIVAATVFGLGQTVNGLFQSTQAQVVNGG